MVLVKAYFGTDARRVTVEDNIPFVELHSLLQKLFSASCSEQSKFWIRYQDEENDLISISTDSDLKEAIIFCTSKSDILRLYIEPGEERNQMSAASGSSGVTANAIPHHTLQHRNNLVLQSLSQPEFAVQVSKMVCMAARDSS